MTARRAFSFLRTVFLVVAITLAIDFAVTLFIPARYLDSFLLARIRNEKAYDSTVLWHHDFHANVDMERTWGLNTYPFKTDALGFHTGECGAEPVASAKTNFVIGDSFIEGLGLAYEQTVGGMLACAWKAQGLATRPLGVGSYSPIIYHRKIASAVERLKVTPREIVVFLDICDIYDETTFEPEVEGKQLVSLRRAPFDRFITWLRHNFTTIGVANEIRLRIFLSTAKARHSTGHACAQWTLDPKVRADWADRGLALAAANLEKIVAQCREWKCRMNLVVYPWPDQVASGDRDSIQVRYWRDWSQRHGVRFIDAFGPYFTAPASEIIEKYYFAGDIHFNAAGTRVLFDEVWKTLGQP